MARFDGKVVVVTGAGSGIGAAAAKRFAEEGASVVLVGRTEDKLRGMAQGLATDRTLVHPADVADRAAVDGMIAATADRFGRLDVLVNNAGVAVFGPFAELEAQDWAKVMATNVDGVFFCCQAALPHLIRSRGCIVNVSSVSGLGGDWMMTAYTASKGAVTNFTRSLAMELGPKGVRVNAVNPSLTVTDMSADIAGDGGLLAKFRERMPLGGPAKPEDIAPVIAFLASDDARFVTGVNLPVDGGVTASNGQPKVA